jgi:CP family cyanate transporter-like MFS transporter
VAEAAGNPARSGSFQLALLWLIGVQLRLTVLAVPPVLPLIHRDLALSEKAVGALSALPVLLLGLAAVPGSLGVSLLGARRACLVGLAIVAVSSAARGIGPSVPMLYGMTLAMGIGIALMQPTLPTLVSEWFPARAGFATALYANGLLIGEAVPAAVTIPLVLPLLGGSWEASLAFWAAPVLLTAVLLALTAPHRARDRLVMTARWWPDWRDRRLWQVGFLLGGTGGLYFSANAFIPDYLHATGRPELVGPCLSALNIGQLPASAIILMFARRLTGSRMPLVASTVLAALGVTLFLTRPEFAVVATSILGFCGGVQLVLSLALPPLLAPAHEVHRMSAGMFAIGYLTSFAVPPIGGAIWDVTGVPATAFAAAAGCIALAFASAVSLSNLSPARTAPAGSAPRR